MSSTTSMTDIESSSENEDVPVSDSVDFRTERDIYSCICALGCVLLCFILFAIFSLLYFYISKTT